jgi:hypothetical protein
MPYFTYDTSVFIARNLINFYELPRSFRMSAVVQLEPIVIKASNFFQRM